MIGLYGSSCSRSPQPFRKASSISNSEAPCSNAWAAACLARARGRLHGDRDALAESVTGWERIGARFERACTLLLLADRAAEAIDLFVYSVKKAIGALAAALGGLDVLVFSGGIGEHAAKIRAGVCEGLGFLGIALDGPSNAAGKPLISAESGRVQVRVIPTDEEMLMARQAARLLAAAL